MIKRFLRAFLLAVVSLVLIYDSVLAAWTFFFPTTILDTSGTTRTYYPVMLGFGGQSLVDAGYWAANGTNSNIQIGSTNLNYMASTTNVAVVIPVIIANSLANVDVYAGYTPLQSGFPIITGWNGYATVPDNNTLEMGGNGTISTSGYIDTTQVGANLTYKPNAFSTNISASGSISSQIIDPSGNTINLTASGVTSANHFVSVALFDNGLLNGGFETNDPPDNWTAVLNPGATWAQSHTAYAQTHSGNLTGFPAGESYVTQSVSAIPYRGMNATATAMINVDPSFIANSMQMTLYDDIGDTATNLSSAHGVWQQVSVKCTIGLAANTVTVKFRVNDGVAWHLIDEAILENNNTGYNRILYIDGVERDGTGTTYLSINNSVSDWVFGRGNVAPYTDNITITVNGTQQLYLSPTVMLNGTLIPDRSGSGNNGTITWGSNTGIALTYGEMTSYESYMASSTTGTGFNLTSMPLPSGWFAVGTNTPQLPFYDSFSQVAADMGVPVQTFYFWGIIAVAMGLFLFLIAVTRSAMLACVAMIAVLGFGASMTIIPTWMVFGIVVVFVAILYLWRQYAY